MPPLRLIHLLALALCVALVAPAGASAARGTGGAMADDPDEHGGVRFGTPAPPPPVAERFTVSPGRIAEGKRPVVRLRIEQPDSDSVRARVVVVRAASGRSVARIDLGRVRVGRTVRVPWPKRAGLRAGRYVVRVHARDALGHVLARAAKTSGKAKLVVTKRKRPKPRPKPRPTPKPKPAPKPVAKPKPVPPEAGGVFPVRGSWNFGGEGSRFGAGRTGHKHEGQDVAAPSGTPIVSPVAGTVAFVDYQKSGAGWYVVLNADDGRSMFFAHMQTGSVAVKPGQRVRAGSALGRVGTTGASSGPHLHFEIWVGGWRDRGGHPIDPLPQLRAWAR